MGGGPLPNASGRNNRDPSEDQKQDSQLLRNAKQANSDTYHSDYDCVISERNPWVAFLSHQHHSTPYPSNNHGKPHESRHYGKDASNHGSPPSFQLPIITDASRSVAQIRIAVFQGEVIADP